jgi:hypothetical protein
MSDRGGQGRRRYFNYLFVGAVFGVLFVGAFRLLERSGDRARAPASAGETVETAANVDVPAPPPAPAEGPTLVAPPAPAAPIARRAVRDGGAAPDAGDENRARFRALHQALQNTTPDAARLFANFARLQVVAPAEAKTLIEMKQRGVPEAELVAYVKNNFPPDLPARAIALRWLGVAGGAAVNPAAAAPGAAPVTGTLTPRGTDPSP